jgi:hypothetical protein
MRKKDFSEASRRAQLSLMISLILILECLISGREWEEDRGISTGQIQQRKKAQSPPCYIIKAKPYKRDMSTKSLSRIKKKTMK